MTTEELLAAYKADFTDYRNAGRVADARDRVEDALEHVEACALGDEESDEEGGA
jgi:hypothetical protein